MTDVELQSVTGGSILGLVNFVEMLFVALGFIFQENQ